MIKKEIIKEIQNIVGEDNVITSKMYLQLYEYDAYLETSTPDLVVFPTSTDHVSKVVKIAHREKIPFVPRGLGTNLSGGSIAVRGGILIEMAKMNKILEIDIENQRAVVEPGLFNLGLSEALKPYGYYYIPDPASQKACSIGGNIGENSGGPYCFKYGVTTNHVLGLEIVLPDGDIIQTGGKSLDTPGYDLTGLFVGSEGTLGIVTKIIVRIVPLPEKVKTLLAIYNTIEDAGNTVSAIVAEGMIPATLEMMDKLIIKAVEESMQAGFPLDAEAVLIIELDGLKDGMDRMADKIVEICKENNAREVKVAKTEEERTKIWTGRKGAFGAVARLAPNYLVADGTVPRTKLPEVLKKVEEVGRKYSFQIPNVFHAGDGNLHPLVLFDGRNEEEKKRVVEAGMEILKICAEAGGTISGEHGIGLEKTMAMHLVYNEKDIEAMVKVKRAFDSENLCNPGKIFPETITVKEKEGVLHET